MRGDIVVVGGGPAGLAAAIAARLQGMDVTLVDFARPPIDKACGEGILPAGIEALRQLGVKLTTDEGFPFRGIRFIDRGGAVAADFLNEPARAVRRTRLHELLVDRAAQIGVRLKWQTRYTSEDKFGWVVGADGQNSRVRAAAGLDACRNLTSRFGFRRHYRASPWSDFVDVHWGQRAQVYVTPVAPDEVGVAVLTRDSHLRVDQALDEFPELRRRLCDAPTASVERGCLTASRKLWRVVSGQTALTGDASGSVDAITGDGLSLSFCQAIVLAQALVSEDLQAYQAEHSRLMRRPRIVERGLLLLDRCPFLRRSVIRTLALDPAMFARLLACHVPAGELTGDRKRSPVPV